MLEEMPAPQGTTTNDEYESSDNNNDFGHIIPSFMKNVNTWPQVVRIEPMHIVFVFYVQYVFVTSSFGLNFLSRACKIVFGAPSFAHILPPWVEQVAVIGLMIANTYHRCRMFKRRVKECMDVDAFCKPSKKVAKN